MPRIVLNATGLILLFFAIAAWGQGNFRIGDIQIEGVQRLEPGTVLTYLPLRVGDRLTPERSQKAIRALYDTGLFDDVSLSRDGDTLIVDVKERPEIARFSIEGNKHVGGDKLKETLEKQGMARGDLFRRSQLDQIAQALRQQYYANGYYSVKIDPEVTELSNNRVAIDITVHEGPVAAIKDINIIGNHQFSDAQIKDDVLSLQESKPFYTHILTFWRSEDQYSRQQLLGDLESLRSFYQDRGYIRFNISSVQVSLSPDKRDIYLTINIHEGEQYTVSGYQFAGDMIIPETSVQRLITVEKGQVFKRSAVSKSVDNIESGLADFGYAFADVKPLTRIDDDNDTVELTFFISPGKQTYVRRITFSGNDGTNDRTLRREMRQFEGSPFSRRAVERSRTRLARLPYIESVDVDTDPVPGTEDMVDVNYDVSERPPGKLQFGIGFSDQQGFLINGSISHNNFLGTGNTVSFGAQTADYSKRVSASWTDPFFTEDGVSRTLSAYYRSTRQLVRHTSRFDMDAEGAALTFGIPISEYASIRLGGGIDNNKITTNRGDLSDQVEKYIDDNGRQATTFELRTGWDRDTRNKSYFATRGSHTKLDLDVKVPGSDLEYYAASLEHTRYFRVGDWVPFLSDKFVVSVDGHVAYTDIYGKGTDVPPYAHYFVGGAQSLRGFSSGGVGPRDSYDNAYGGKFLTTLQTEMAIPMPFESDGKTTQFALFYDMGNVFADVDDFDVGDLRSSAGVAFYWFTPFFGLLRLSYAPYVNAKSGDDISRFQFSFGVGF